MYFLYFCHKKTIMTKATILSLEQTEVAGFLPVYKSGLRLYCLRLSDSVLIVGNGGVKNTQTYEEDKDLNGYVISLQKLDALLKADIRNGVVRIEKTEIVGVDNKDYDI